MPKAYVLINVDAGYEELVLQEIKNVEGVKEAYVSYGVYDLMVKIAAETMEQLKELISNRLRTSKNVRSTLTLILTEE